MMASSNSCETEVLWLKSEIIPKLLKDNKLINGIAETDLDKFHIKNITAQLISSQEAFMLTKCYRAQLTYEYNGAVDEIHFFVKKTPQLPQQIFDAINFKALFNNEILAYEHIIPALEKYGKFKLNTAKFYYADLKSNAATIITEDFGSHNWTVAKDRFNLSLDHVVLAVKYLAQFHAAGFALSATHKIQFKEITQGLIASRYTTDSSDPSWDIQMVNAMKRTLRATWQYQKNVKDVFLDKYENLLSNSGQYCRQVVEPREPFVTLCHGDYLRNNVAYKYAKGADTNQPIDIMMFDLQTLTVSSPMLDLAISLSLSTFAEVRQKHFKEIFKVYCDHIKVAYERFAQQPMPEFLRFEPLLKEYIRFLPYSIFTCSWFLKELVEPHELSSEELFKQRLSDEETINNTLAKGGEMVDRELAHQVKELYDLSTQYNVNVF